MFPTFGSLSTKITDFWTVHNPVMQSKQMSYKTTLISRDNISISYIQGHKVLTITCKANYIAYFS